MLKKIFLISGLFIFFLNTLRAEELPLQTELLEKEEFTTQGSEVVLLRCCSKLSYDEILSFYRKRFLAQGLKEFSLEGIFIFSRGPFITKTLYFLSEEDNQLCYKLEERYAKRISVLPIADFSSPRQLDFMPTFLEATEFVYSTYFAPMTGVWYLSFKDAEEVANFYLKNMPDFGWKLLGDSPRQGVYSFSEWFVLIDPFSKVLPRLEEEGYPEYVPPLKVRGRTLSFTKDKESCTITIYKFEDILEKAEGTVWDVSALATYGTTVIGVFYFE